MALGCNGNEPHPLASLGLFLTMAASLKTVAKPAKSKAFVFQISYSLYPDADSFSPHVGEWRSDVTGR